MSDRQKRNEKALEKWEALAYKNGWTDALVNDLLEDIAGDKYRTSENSDDPIWETIQALDDKEIEEFLRGCEDIERKEGYRLTGLTEFTGYNEDGIPVFVTVKGTPEAN